MRTHSHRRSNFSRWAKGASAIALALAAGSIPSAGRAQLNIFERLVYELRTSRATEAQERAYVAQLLTAVEVRYEEIRRAADRCDRAFMRTAVAGLDVGLRQLQELNRTHSAPHLEDALPNI